MLAIGGGRGDACTRAQANATGRSSKTVREFLEKHYTNQLAESDDEVIKLTVKALMEVVQSGAKNMEVAIMRRHEPMRMLETSELEVIVAAIEREKEAEAERKKAAAIAATGPAAGAE